MFLGGTIMLDKIKNFFNEFRANQNLDVEEEYREEDGFEDFGYEEDVIEDSEPEERQDGFANAFNFKRKKIQMLQDEAVTMKIVKPASFDQTNEVCAYLKQKDSIVLNLEFMQKDTARRFLDYM